MDGAAAAERCKRYRKRILGISQKVTALHIAPAFSCLEITDAIYHEFMRDRDVFVMSKGHGCIAQYVILEGLGVIESAELERYCAPGGMLGAHPDRGTPGIEASTGSLGHGLGIAVGIAYAEKLKGTDCLVYVVMSDGELQEGSTWEAVQMAANKRLDNLLLFVDWNDFGGLERLSKSHPAVLPIAEKFSVFGWEAAQGNGHDALAIVGAVKERSGDSPFVYVGKTVKGRGVSYMEKAFARGDGIWHYRSPSPEEYAAALRELVEIRS